MQTDNDNSTQAARCRLQIPNMRQQFTQVANNNNNSSIRSNVLSPDLVESANWMGSNYFFE